MLGSGCAYRSRFLGSFRYRSIGLFRRLGCILVVDPLDYKIDHLRTVAVVDVLDRRIVDRRIVLLVDDHHLDRTIVDRLRIVVGHLVGDRRKIVVEYRRRKIDLDLDFGQNCSKELLVRGSSIYPL